MFFHVENAPYLYQELGCKTAARMPFKEIATSDSIYMHTIPPSSDKEGRPALRRMMEVTVGVIVPAEVRMKETVSLCHEIVCILFCRLLVVGISYVPRLLLSSQEGDSLGGRPEKLRRRSHHSENHRELDRT